MKPTISAKAEELLARLEKREGKAAPSKPERAPRFVPLDPTFPFPPAPIGALAGKNPLDGER